MDTHKSDHGSIRARLDGGRIMVVADAQDAPVVAALPGATRTAKMPPRTWNMPLNCESIDLLRGVGAHASRELISEAKRLASVRRYVEAQKRATHAEPLQLIPIKTDVRLYTHQTKGYNIVLGLFGYLLGSWR